MFDRVLKIVLGFMLFVIVYFYGALSSKTGYFPAEHVEPGVVAVSSLVDAFDIDNYSKTIRWVADAPEKTGLVGKVDGAYQPGHILYTTTHDRKVHLIDENGEALHEWDFSFEEAWPGQTHIISVVPITDKYAYARDAHVYENGDILVMVTIGGTTPWGIGLIKLDKDSNILWTYDGYANNDFHVTRDGRIFVVEHDIREDKPDVDVDVFVPFLEDNIVEIGQDGKPIKRISLIDAAIEAGYQAWFMQFENDGKGDPTHSNSIEDIPEDHPSIEWLKRGYLVVSVRNLNSLVVLDPESGKVIKIIEVRARMQHDIDYLPNRHFMLFDNQGDFEGEGYTRVIEFEPDTQNIVWSYNGGDGEEELQSQFWGETQRMDIGTTMITYGEKGEIREVDADGNIVWRYIAPFTNVVEGKERVASMTHAEKLPASYFKFEFNRK